MRCCAEACIIQPLDLLDPLYLHRRMQSHRHTLLQQCGAVLSSGHNDPSCLTTTATRGKAAQLCCHVHTSENQAASASRASPYEVRYNLYSADGFDGGKLITVTDDKAVQDTCPREQSHGDNEDCLLWACLGPIPQACTPEA